MAKLQLDGYERGYFHKIWKEYYRLGKNYASETVSSKFIRCQNPYQLQNLKIFSTFHEHKNPHGQNFWNLFFYLKRQGYIVITRAKIKLGSHHLHK